MSTQCALPRGSHDELDSKVGSGKRTGDSGYIGGVYRIGSVRQGTGEDDVGGVGGGFDHGESTKARSKVGSMARNKCKGVLTQRCSVSKKAMKCFARYWIC